MAARRSSLAPARLSVAPSLDINGLPEGDRRYSINFVEDKVKTEASNLTLRQSIIPVTMVTVLFFLWGFAYGLLDVLNKHFQVTLDITRAESTGLQGAYFGAYFIAPLTFSGYILRRFGYKITFIVGLVLYGVGALLYWPSGVYRSFGGFCGATFVVGCGLATLETSANPFIAVCGPPRYSEIRLNISQAFQAVGSVVAPIIAAQVFFKNVGSDDLSTVQYVYLGLACFVFLLAVAFYFAPIPEITDEDMAAQAEETGFVDDNKPIYLQANLMFGVVAQFAYVGSQVAVATMLINYLTEENPGLRTAMASNYLAVAQSCFAVGRFVASGMLKFVRPRYVLLVFIIGCVAFTAAAMRAFGKSSIAVSCMILFFESCIFPLIFTIALRGLGRHTKRGASFIVASVSGGALFPFIMGQTADAKNSTRFAFAVPLAGFLSTTCYAIYINIFQKHRLDMFSDSQVGTKQDPMVDTSTGRSKSVSYGAGVGMGEKDKETAP